MDSVPESLNQITAAWLTEQLGCRVTTSAYQPMPGMVGALGEVGILTLTYDEPTDLPTQVVAKMPLDNDAARMYNGLMNFYPRESGWYRTFIDESPFRAPRAVLNIGGGETGLTLLMLERVTGCENGDILAGTTYERHAAVVETLARHHATFWGRNSLRNHSWLYDWRTPGLHAGADLMRSVWPIFHDMKPGYYPNDLKMFLENGWVNDTPRWLAYCDTLPFTLCHGDFQLDNILFDNTTANDTGHVVIDFQGCMRSFAGFDLGWYLASSLPRDQVAFEGELLGRYRTALAAAGGPHLSHDDLMHQLALFTLYAATGQVLPALQDTDAFGENGARMRHRFDQFLNGSISAALRWDTMGRMRDVM
jgi:Phosphotransferase enzyme family